MYKTEADGSITRIDGVTVPRDITSPAYQQYLYWQQYGQYVGPEIMPEAPVVDIPVGGPEEVPEPKGK